MPNSNPLSASFLKSAADFAQCPVDDVPELAFVGRSNVGKSSTLNKLTGINKLARVSKTPGRTQLINFFNLEVSPSTSGGRLVDLPGFGYAKVSKQQRARFGELVDEYLTRRSNLKGVVLVMDARHPPFEFDQQMIKWCNQQQLNLLVLLNKSDKLKRNRQIQAKSNLENIYGGHLQLSIESFSATKGTGVESVRGILRHWLE
ncbi:MAG: ribosome biogenesis GTP-binding protein YihA/YsxC [Gammaproteobacteria bacterium]|nr:ribosome biogenesis GTP-binding protein YihA/YsxC [Gammaproteobacteria bacterium]